MDIVTKNIEIEMDLPPETDKIYLKLAQSGIDPLRFSIVKVVGNIVTINVTFQNL